MFSNSKKKNIYDKVNRLTKLFLGSKDFTDKSFVHKNLFFYPHQIWFDLPNIRNDGLLEVIDCHMIPIFKIVVKLINLDPCLVLKSFLITINNI